MSDVTQSAGGDGSGKMLSLPAKIVVSLRVGFVLALANIVCVVIFSLAWMHVRAEPKEINVTGSAKKQMDSDLVVWSVVVSAVDPQLVPAYTQLQDSAARVSNFLAGAGIPSAQIMVSPINTIKRRAKDAQGHDTEKIIEYELNQTVEVTSGDVGRVDNVSRTITSLIQSGVLIESQPPKFLYTKLADLKIAMLADATKDATARAQQVASNSGAKLGSILEARMGVMQITPVHSNEVSDSGTNDTSSRVKEITAVVTARFSLE